jgi:hypothetical protein
MCVNAKMIPVETVLGIGRGRIKQNRVNSTKNTIDFCMILCILQLY